MAVTDEVDPFDAGRSVGYTRTEEKRVQRSPTLIDCCIDGGAVSEIYVDVLGSGE